MRKRYRFNGRWRCAITVFHFSNRSYGKWVGLDLPLTDFEVHGNGNSSALDTVAHFDTP